jgi:hypothetical protein
MLFRAKAALVAALTLIACAAVAPAHADVIGTPVISGGGAVPIPPEPGQNLGNETLLAQVLAAQINSGNPNLKGSITEAVYRNSAGTLDFAYQLSNTGSVTLGTVVVSDFTGFATNAGSLTPPLPANASDFNAAGVAAPTPSSRTLNGANVFFDAFNLAGGATSAVFFVHTDALDFNALGFANVVANSTDAGGGVVPNLLQPKPLAPVPEPSSLCLMLAFGGVVGGVQILRRLKARSA